MDKIIELKRWIKNIFKTQLEPEDQFNRLIKTTYRNLNTGEISEEFYDGNEFRYKFRVFRYFEKDAKVDDHLEITRGPHYTRIDIIWVTDDEINEIKEQVNKHLRVVVFNRGMLDRVTVPLAFLILIGLYVSIISAWPWNIVGLAGLIAIAWVLSKLTAWKKRPSSTDVLFSKLYEEYKRRHSNPPGP